MGLVWMVGLFTWLRLEFVIIGRKIGVGRF